MSYETVQTALRTCTQWHKSSYSFPEGQECVEITTGLAGWVGVRDSKLGSGSPLLAFTHVQWQAMLGAARAGQLTV